MHTAINLDGRRLADAVSYHVARATEVVASAARSGCRCQAPAERGKKVCRFHGARAGAPKGKANGAYRHGRFTTEAVAGRKLMAGLLKGARTTLARLAKPDGQSAQRARCGRQGRVVKVALGKSIGACKEDVLSRVGNFIFTSAADGTRMSRTWKLDKKMLDEVKDEEWEIQKRALYLLGEAADLLLLRRGVHESTLRPLAKHLEAISDLISKICMSLQKIIAVAATIDSESSRVASVHGTPTLSLVGHRRASDTGDGRSFVACFRLGSTRTP